jgi:hypothetical protein
MEFKLASGNAFCVSIYLVKVDPPSGASDTVPRTVGAPLLFREKMNNLVEIENALREAQNIVLRRTWPTDLQNPGPQPTISSELLSFTRSRVLVEATGPSMPTLYLYDLPGTFSEKCYYSCTHREQEL